MFTGIIKNVEKIRTVASKNQSLFIGVGLPKGWKLKKGQSICINGICSTVRAMTNRSFEVEYMPETQSKTTVLTWAPGFLVNLERSMKLSDFIDGHLVAGHVDGPAKITKIETKGDSKVFTIKAPKDLITFIAPKGSIAIDGVSLTVVDMALDSFMVSLVSYTLLHTNLGAKKVGESVNIETDMIAKYVVNILKK